MHKSLCLIILSIGISSIAFAQSCADNVTPTTDITQYQASDAGTLIHQKIMWSRCAIGQTWINGKCSGKALLKTWDEAQELAINTSLYSFDDWRLPTIHELSAITELSCENPAINLHLFPDTPSVSFWTNTVFVNDNNNAWQVFFGSGENHTAKKSTTAAIRLVRTLTVK